MTEFEKAFLSKLEILEKEGKVKKDISIEERVVNDLKKNFMQMLPAYVTNSKPVTVKYYIPHIFSYEPFMDEFQVWFGNFNSVADIEKFARKIIELFPSESLIYNVSFVESERDIMCSRGYATLYFTLDVEMLKESQ